MNANFPSPESLLPTALVLIAPISAPNPVGDDPKYSAEFEFVKSEIAKMTERDWDQIHANACKVLTHQAKDITMLCYGLLAATVAKGWAEGAAMAQALSKLCQDHWDVIHPLRERGRLNSFKWLSEERTMGTIQQVPASSDDHQALVYFAQALHELVALLNEKFPDSPPSIKSLQQFVEEKANATKPVPVEPEPKRLSESAESSRSDSLGVSTTTTPSRLGEGASKTDLLNAVRQMARSLSSLEPDNPVGYKLLRISRWQEISIPPKNDKGILPFPPPHPQRVAFLEGMFSQKSWETILEKSETAFTEPGLHFWFDLQYFAVHALQGMGREACAEAIGRELRDLVGRVGPLLEFKFNDGTPLANGRTKAWIEDLSKRANPLASTSAATREDSLDADLATAKGLADKGLISEALDLLQAGLLYGDQRNRTLRQLEIARFALQHDKIRSALAVSTEIADRAEKISLASWEPDLSRQISEIHLKSLSAAIDGKMGDVAWLTQKRESVIFRVGCENPALISRFEF